MAGALPGLRDRLSRAGTLAAAPRLIPRMSRSCLLARGAAVFAAMLIASAAAAAEAGFCEGLSPGERTMAGIPRLEPAQVAALDALAGRDVALAHEGGVTAFSSGFTARRTPKERSAAGIDLLTEKELSALDALVARAIAYGPAPLSPFAYSPPAPQSPGETLVPSPRRPEVHGDVSATVGGGHGSSFYGASFDLFVTDPSGRFTLGVGVSEFRAKGPMGPFGPYCLIPCGPILPGW